MSVTEPSDPSVVASPTVSPPVVRSLPLASLSWTVIVDVEAPSATIETGAAEMVDCVSSAGPGTKLTTALSMIAVALSDPVTMAVPAVVEEVRVAV